MRRRRAFGALTLALLASLAGGAQQLRVVVHQGLAGGEVHVEGVAHVRYVPSPLRPTVPMPLATTWWTQHRRARRLVTVREWRHAGQDAASWQLEHARLVTAAQQFFPPVP